MRFRILCPLGVEDGSQTVPLGGHQPRALLARPCSAQTKSCRSTRSSRTLGCRAASERHALIWKLRRRLEGEAAEVVSTAPTAKIAIDGGRRTNRAPACGVRYVRRAHRTDDSPAPVALAARARAAR